MQSLDFRFSRFCHLDEGEITLETPILKSSIFVDYDCAEWIKIHPYNMFCCFGMLSLYTYSTSENEISSLAPIEVKILLCRGSAEKIETDSGTSRLLKTELSAPEKP